LAAVKRYRDIQKVVNALSLETIICSVGIACLDIKVGCFPGIRTEQLQRVIEKRDLGNPDAVVIHVGTNDIKRTRNLDYLTGDV
jgi:hypothetical protein